MCFLHPYTKQNNEIFVQKFGCGVALWRPWLCKYSIRFQFIKLKLVCETLKNEKENFLLDIQTKLADIPNKTLHAAIDAERTFKYKWPYTNTCSSLISLSSIVIVSKTISFFSFSVAKISLLRTARMPLLRQFKLFRFFFFSC